MLLHHDKSKQFYHINRVKKRKQTYDHLNQCRRIVYKNTISVHIKNFQQARNREELLQSIQGHLKK